ncbi:DinB family protein [Glycomyces endophyticus]|uniref:DinB family protein n=1 Tax=Glycomyces endophyticus TaxID=480996 RepID=A0ABN2GVA9_9ACTN
MEINELLADAFGRVHGEVAGVLDGLSQDDLEARPGPGANSIAWLVWHIARVQDDHVSEAAGHEQAWTAGGWEDRFDLGLPAGDTGYGHTAEQAGRVAGVSGADLLAYYEAVHAQTLAYVAGLTAADLDRVVDVNWTPHVTLGVRLVSVIDDNQQHGGQAAYVRGLLGA